MKYVAVALAAPALVVAAILGYYYVVFSRQIEARLHGERERVLPRVFARPLELRKGQSLGAAQLIDRLNDLGYAHRPRTEQPGEFTVGRDAMLLIPRAGDHQGQLVRLVFGGRPPKSGPTGSRSTRP